MSTNGHTQEEEEEEEEREPPPRTVPGSSDYARNPRMQAPSPNTKENCVAATD